MRKTNRTEECRERFLDMCPEMISKIHDLIADPGTPAPSKVQLIGMVLERGLGKSEMPVKLTTSREAIENAEMELMAIAREIQKESGMTDDTDLSGTVDDSYRDDADGTECGEEGEEEDE